MNKISRVILIATVAASLGTLQVRSSIATWEARSTFLYVPFHLKPCTNIIDLPSYADRDVLNRSDVLLAVNGRPYTGETVYRQELRRARRYLDRIRTLPDKEVGEALSRWPFRVTIQSGSAAPRTVEVFFANCTCGSLSMQQVVWYCILPSTIALLAGLFVVGKRPQTAVAWLFLVGTVCLAQIAFVPEWSSEWSQSGNPLEWQDWLRIPALVGQTFFSASWPAWMILLAVYCFRERPNRLAVWSALTPIFVLAFAKTVIAVGSAESFQAVAWMDILLRKTSSEITVLSLACAAIAAASLGRLAAVVSAALTGIMAILIYWPAPIPTSVVVWSYANKTIPLVPAFHRGLNIVGPIYAATLTVVIIIAGWQGLRCRSSALGAASAALSVLLLVVPFIYQALSTEWALWWTEYVPQAVLACLYVGLIGASWSVIRIANRCNAE